MFNDTTLQSIYRIKVAVYFPCNRHMFFEVVLNLRQISAGSTNIFFGDLPLY
jgi:hypothetical protein